MEMYSILNELEELIGNSTKIPFTRRLIVDEDKFLDYIDRIRASLPEEMRQAKWVIQEREKVIEGSKKEAERIIESAQKELEKRADESEIVQQAKVSANEILQKAEGLSNDIKQGARVYADEILQKLEEELNKVIKEIKNGREELKIFKKPR
ncbi:ATPase [Peptococcaceae bacterium SCADC1_2_3]|nr:ATPase [Peptococcaceae bacterium SCADC1_2_3]HBQ28139.1 ATPase [Desulfotomaculum sp.]KFI35388.1 ATPase [Peptococcaceae bacterium SCADC1_2_3]KFI35505.1 ATPase [Peptococcaceae bacterium SCADC1_2_3]KFI36817.1 ATPase [Peptococcaceae bacterium SCADC1_2_3]